MNNSVTEEPPGISALSSNDGYQCQPWPDAVKDDIIFLKQKLHELESRCRHLELIVHRILNDSN
jgi:hypothetical protein